MTLFRCCTSQEVSHQNADAFIFTLSQEKNSIFEKSLLEQEVQRKIKGVFESEFNNSSKSFETITFYESAPSRYKKVIALYQPKKLNEQNPSQKKSNILELIRKIFSELGQKQFSEIIVPVEEILNRISSTADESQISFFIENFIKECHQFTEKSYSFKKSTAPKNQNCIPEIVFILEKSSVAIGKAACQRGQIIANALSQTQRLANLPANVCTPEFLKNEVLELQKRFPNVFSVVIHDTAALKKMGMNGILGVASGSSYSPYLLEVHYHPEKSVVDRPIVFVGKGVTFDSGGLSIKPAGGMGLMKYDMCGTATVFGILEALAELKLSMPIIGLMPVCENMVSQTSYRPGDILTLFSGSTVEINNTDAEGRLILADALTYAEKTFNPREIIDIATLTGACVVALGSEYSGLFSNNDLLEKNLKQASVRSGDKLWAMPMDESYDHLIQSSAADLSNCGRTRDAGAITAARFLSKFLKSTPWAHLDVAGTAYIEKGTTRATGRPVPLLLDYLIHYKND